MLLCIQRVTQADVTVQDQMVGAIRQGLVVLTGIGHDDTEILVRRMAEKVVHLRIFDNAQGQFDRSLLQVEGEVLVVSQFTLFADARRGRRPGFAGAARPEHARPLCDLFAQTLRNLGVRHVACGIFGEHMHVRIENDGPVTVWLNSQHVLK